MRAVALALLLAAALASGCASSDGPAASPKPKIPPQPTITPVDRPASKQLLTALRIEDVGGFACTSVTGRRISDARCKELFGIVDHPRDVRVVGTMDLGGSPRSSKAFFVTFLDDRGRLCYDVQVLARRPVDPSPFQTLRPTRLVGGLPLECHRPQQCGPICLLEYGNLETREEVLAGPVTTRAVSIRIKYPSRRVEEYRLNGPPIAAIPGRRIFILAVEATGTPVVETFGPNHQLLARCRLLCEIGARATP